MPAQRPRASFEPIAPTFDLKSLVEHTANFSYVDRINCDMIDQQGIAAFEKLILLHVIVGGKPLVIDGYQDRLDPWTYTPRWLRDNCGDKIENAYNLTSKENLPLTLAHYLRNMGLLTHQYFEKPENYREKNRQRMYLKDIDCPPVWWDKLREHLPSMLAYLNDSTGELGGPGAVPDTHGTVPGRRLGKGVARAGDLMSSLPADMRAENLMCYIGHEGTYTPAHREMCASLGHNIMVEASGTVSDDGQVDKPGSSIWFMTESKDRHLVSEYWLGVLGHDIEVEKHFAQVIAWKKAPFNVYVVEQRPGDLILIPPLAPHQVWNRGTRTMKIAWNRTTVETLEMALHEALPRSRVVCRDEQYKNKAIVYYTLQKYSSLLTTSQQQASRMPPQAGHQLLYTGKIKQLIKDYKRLFGLFRLILLSEMFNPDDRDHKSLEYIPFDSNITCAYCRCNIFNRFLTCPNCKDVLGHNAETGEGDPYDVCLDCYAMGRSCACVSGLKFVEQFKWKELTTKYETWRMLIISLDLGQVSDKTPLPLAEERARLGRKTLAEVCKEQLKRRPFKDVKKSVENLDKSEESEQEIEVGDDGTVKKLKKKKSKAWLKNNQTCHVCCHRHPTWKMMQCTTCERSWCFGALFRGWDKMPLEIMQDMNWSCPHCLGSCFAGACRATGKHRPYEPKGTLLGHDTRKVADARSVEALVDFSVSNLNWLKNDDPEDKAETRRLKLAKAEAERDKKADAEMEELEDGDEEVDDVQPEKEWSPSNQLQLDPALAGGPDRHAQGADDEDGEADLARRLQQANSAFTSGTGNLDSYGEGVIHDGYQPVSAAGFLSPEAERYPQPDADESYQYPGGNDELQETVDPLTGDVVRPFKTRKRRDREAEDDAEIHMQKAPKQKKPRMIAAGFRSLDLAEPQTESQSSQAKNEAQKQFEKEKERKRLEKAKTQGRFIMLQAALKNKKSIVVLKIPGSRLAQIAGQQATRIALNTEDPGEGAADAEHELDPPSAPAMAADRLEEAADDILKSDLVPKPVPKPKPADRRLTQPSGIINGTKRAVIPVEKDDSYRQSRRGAKVRKGNNQPSGPPPSLAAKAQQKRDRRSAFEFEEIDIGSDDDDEEDETLPKAKGGRRSLPSYLQDRHDEDVDLPDELPENYRDRGPKTKRAAAKRQMIVSLGEVDPDVYNSGTQRLIDDHRSRKVSQRPSMRLADVTTASHDVDQDGHDQNEEDVSEIVDRLASGEGFPDPRPSSTNLRHQTQKQINEQNRLAKLQALEGLELIERSTPDAMHQQSNSRRSLAEKVQTISSDEEESSDDGADMIPAMRSVTTAASRRP